MGAGESTLNTDINFDAGPSENAFLNKVLADFKDVRSFPADMDAALRDLAADPALFTAPIPAGASWHVDEHDEVLGEVAKAIDAYYPELGESVRSALVPSKMDLFTFWSRFLFQLSRTVRPTYDKEREVAIEAVLKACRVTSEVHSRLVNADTHTKKDRSPVTVADFASQAIIIRELRRAFPDDAVVGEEDAAALRADTDEARAMLKKVHSLTVAALDDQSLTPGDICDAIDHGQHTGGPDGRWWTLDPIDGTLGFLRGQQYAVCVALVERGEVILGVLGCPNLPIADGQPPGCLLIACKGDGATMRSVADDTERPIAVSSVAQTALCSFTESVEAGHSDHSDAARIAKILGVTRPSVRMDSQCKYAAVARGDAQIYLRLPTRKGYEEKIWDHASGFLIVHEAGGRVTDTVGAELDFAQGRTLKLNAGIIATNGLVHEQVVAAVREVLYPSHRFNVAIRGKKLPPPAEIATLLARAMQIPAACVTVEVASQ